jgi:hypothetical protein
MTQDEINEAVKLCVRAALDQPNPTAAILGCVDELKARGWPTAEIQIVRATTIRILAEIHGKHFDEPEPA